MNASRTKELINYLTPYLSENRLSLIEKIIQLRTNHLAIVLEDLFQSHNASAAVRSSECFGIQNIHFIENSNSYQKNHQVDMGSSKWINLHRYNQENQNNTKTCLEKLKNQNYQIIGLALSDQSIPLDEINIEKKTALVFGTEETGLSKDALTLCDQTAIIPMYGFTQSFNISVSVALTLQNLNQRLRQSSINWKLSKTEQNEIKLDWMIKSIKAGEKLVDKFLRENET